MGQRTQRFAVPNCMRQTASRVGGRVLDSEARRAWWKLIADSTFDKKMRGYQQNMPISLLAACVGRPEIRERAVMRTIYLRP
jgi:hypothetical protein